MILLRRAWSKLDVQVVVCNSVGDPFKAWVAGSNPAALTKISNQLADFGRVEFGQPRALPDRCLLAALQARDFLDHRADFNFRRTSESCADK